MAHIEPRAALLAAAADPSADLAEAALWIAVEDCPDVDRSQCLDLLGDLAMELRRRCSEQGEPVAALGALLRERIHLRGAGLGDPRAHYLHHVLRSGAGIPIACSAVWIAVGRRAGVRVEGVGLPGHFCVRVDGRLVDAFSGGESIGEDEARRIGGEAQGAEPDGRPPGWLEPASVRSILARMSRNLRGCYATLEDWPAALRSADRCVALLPAEPAERRDRGLLLWRMGRTEAALGDLRHYLEVAVAAPDQSQVSEMAARLRGFLN